jgi:sedoheptulokinase
MAGRMSEKMKFIGIDIGTTTISAALLEADSHKVLRTKTIENGSFLPGSRKWERIQDANMLIEKARKLLDEFLESTVDVGGIGLTGQMHGIVYVNEEGCAVSPLFTWQDGRGNLAMPDGKTVVQMIEEVCGVKSAAGYGLVTHIYNQKKNLVPEGAAAICTIADYFGMTLTGEKRPKLHSSNAASLGFYDVPGSRFRKKELSLFGVDPGILPDAGDAFSVLGEYRGIPVLTAIGDNQASFLGSAGMREGVLLANMGTGGQISILSNSYFEAPGIEARPLTEGRYLLVGASLCGGRAFAMLENFFREYVKAACGEDKPQYDTLLELAARGAKTSPLEVVTTFSGTRIRPESRGSICGIGEENFTPEALTYGVLYGMARELYDLYKVIEAGTGIQIRSMVASGNGLRKNPVLQKIFSQLFQADMELSACEEEAACGAAIAAESVVKSGNV